MNSRTKTNKEKLANSNPEGLTIPKTPHAASSITTLEACPRSQPSLRRTVNIISVIGHYFYDRCLPLSSPKIFDSRLAAPERMLSPEEPVTDLEAQEVKTCLGSPQYYLWLKQRSRDSTGDCNEFLLPEKYFYLPGQ